MSGEGGEAGRSSVAVRSAPSPALDCPLPLTGRVPAIFSRTYRFSNITLAPRTAKRNQSDWRNG
jgi:hypothetical protein